MRLGTILHNNFDQEKVMKRIEPGIFKDSAPCLLCMGQLKKQDQWLYFLCLSLFRLTLILLTASSSYGVEGER